MSTPEPRPNRTPLRRSWLVPAAAAAVLVAVGAWLLAPAATGLLEARPGPPTTTTSSGAAPGPTATAPTSSATTSMSTSPTPTSASGAPTSPASTAPGPAATEPVWTDTGEDPPEELWRAVAEGFATDFATPGEDWAQRLAAWTTPELAEAYAYTVPTRQPSAKLVDLEASEEGDVSVRVLATYADADADAGAGGLALDLQVLLTPDGWRVSSATSPSS